MDGRNLLGAAGADRARRNKAKIVQMAVPVLAMLLLLLTAAAAVAMAPDGRARFHALFCSNHFVMMCVLSQINLACLFARKAARARTLATRRFYAVGAVACFVELALKPYRIRLLCHAAVEDGA
ncbi:hypothetical protein CFC21_022658 [Triticum aestivum]|uniref:Uncharacterized protein n=2 Tax=Triticum aestivum TaxID=4565 RepID=A0A3B6C320_WHEAT|nr:uncharacterized protein LOC123041059 [Triticum aestivum]KAF7007752.1 hypothetical protein CFC21_022658 [Triticum aestivum]